MWASKVIDLGFTLGVIWQAFSKTVMKVRVTERPLYDMVVVIYSMRAKERRGSWAQTGNGREEDKRKGMHIVALQPPLYRLWVVDLHLQIARYDITINCRSLLAAVQLTCIYNMCLLLE